MPTWSTGRGHCQGSSFTHVKEYRPSLHPKVADGFGRRRAPINVKLAFVPPVGAQMSAENPAILARARLASRFEHHGTRPVAEQHACRAVAPIDNAGKRFRADH